MDCKYFDGCSAPLCPKDKGVVDRIWFTNEDMCLLADVSEWVRRQRKISRRAMRDGYFTVAMLKHECRINKGMKGIDPDGTDRERAACEAAWFKAHPVITEEERERNRALAAESRAFGGGFGTAKTTPEQGVNAVPGEKGTRIPHSA